MTIKDFAKLIRQCQRNVERRCSVGDIPARKIRKGKSYVWEIDDDFVKKMI